jgi:hypothetical protein
MAENYKEGGFEYDRYIIKKSNGEPVSKDAQYFVMRIDKDPHARIAALAYADSVEADNPKFARQLRNNTKQYQALQDVLDAEPASAKDCSWARSAFNDGDGRA